ncbi:MAG: helix-hairpin-helix domain-containing protein [Bacteroidota bacterium]
MNKKLQVFTMAFALFAVACQSNNKTEETSEAEVETAAEETAEVEETAVEETAITAVLNANLATVEELSAIEGMTSESAQAVIDQRPFLTLNDLDEFLAGTLDDSQRKALYTSVFVPFNLNTTAEDDFKMIPGVGDRMAHEFEEYRPYQNLAQFRREIGKYVDETEVARYEQYVFVPVELNSASEEDILALPGVGSRMAHEFEEYRPYQNMEQFRREIGKYVDENELARLERFVYIAE